jgi:hypothetical protein
MRLRNLSVFWILSWSAGCDLQLGFAGCTPAPRLTPEPPRTEAVSLPGGGGAPGYTEVYIGRPPFVPRRVPVTSTSPPSQIVETEDGDAAAADASIVQEEVDAAEAEDASTPEVVEVEQSTDGAAAPEEGASDEERVAEVAGEENTTEQIDAGEDPDALRARSYAAQIRAQYGAGFTGIGSGAGFTGIGSGAGFTGIGSGAGFTGIGSGAGFTGIGAR